MRRLAFALVPRVLAALLVLALVGALAAQAQTATPLPATPVGTPMPGTPDSASALAAVLAAARAGSDVPGIAVAVFRCDAVLAEAADGVRRADRPEPVTPADPFHLGSNAKAMTATMLATLVEEGTLAWSARPADVVPGLVGGVNPAFADVTLAQLLAHRAGLPGWEELADVPAFQGTPAEQRRAAAALLLGGEPAGPVGAYRYSNAGYAVAAAMAEAAAGQSWDALMEQRLFAPLGIRATFGWPAGPGAPWGHALIDGRLTPVDPEGSYRVPAVIAPAGDVSLSLRDTVAFAQLHLCGLQDRPRLLSAATFATLHTAAGSAGGEGERYALGWVLVPVAGTTASAHQGSAGTFEAVTALLPELDLGVIVLSNAGEEAGSAVVNAVVEQALTPYLPA